MKILIADKFPAHWKEVLTKQGHTLTDNPELDENTLPAAIKDNEIFEHRIRTLTEKRRNDIL